MRALFNRRETVLFDIANLLLYPAQSHLRDRLAGSGYGVYVNWSLAVATLVWPFTVTVTSTVRALCLGETTTMEVSDQLEIVAAALPPKETFDVPWLLPKPLPLIVTTVPPAAGPLVGLMFATAGAAV